MIIPAEKYSFKHQKGFIVLEGVNGSGKSTLQARIANFFRSKGKDVVCTREPGATVLGKEIRSLVQESKAGEISTLAELLLFAADRAEHVQKVILPSLAENKIVISDRYFYSTIAFQGFGRKLDFALIEQATEMAISGVLPDLVILLDLDPKEGLSRISNGSVRGGSDSFEKEGIDFHDRIRAGFFQIAKDSPTPFLVIDAQKSPDEIFLEAEKVLCKFV